MRELTECWSHQRRIDNLVVGCMIIIIFAMVNINVLTIFQKIRVIKQKEVAVDQLLSVKYNVLLEPVTSRSNRQMSFVYQLLQAFDSADLSGPMG